MTPDSILLAIIAFWGLTILLGFALDLAGMIAADRAAGRKAKADEAKAQRAHELATAKGGEQ